MLTAVALVVISMAPPTDTPRPDILDQLDALRARVGQIERQVTGRSGPSTEFIRLVRTWAKRHPAKWLGANPDRHSWEDDCFEIEGMRRELARLVKLSDGRSEGQARPTREELDRLWKDHCGGGGPGSRGDRATRAWEAAAQKLRETGVESLGLKVPRSAIEQQQAVTYGMVTRGSPPAVGAPPEAALWVLVAAGVVAAPELAPVAIPRLAPLVAGAAAR